MALAGQNRSITDDGFEGLRLNGSQSFWAKDGLMNHRTSIGRHVRCLQICLMLATVGACSTEHLQPRPAGWPSPAAGAADCSDILGRYIDPSASLVGQNIAPGEVDAYRDKLESASYVFGLRVEDPRFRNINPGRLTFTLSRNEVDAIVVDFQIDDQAVASNTISKSQWACSSQGLTMTVQARDNAPIDKVPGHAVTRREVTMYRVGDALYVRSMSVGSAYLYDVLPWWSKEVYWHHYQSAP